MDTRALQGVLHMVCLHSQRDVSCQAVQASEPNMHACAPFQLTTNLQTCMGRRLNHRNACISSAASHICLRTCTHTGMCHVNVIPLNPTSKYLGAPAQADAVAAFCATLGKYGIPATPRLRRGIDIDAGCGQLTAAVSKDKVLGRGL